MEIEDYVNSSPPTSSLTPIAACLVEIDLPSPTDHYRIQSRSYLAYGTAERIAELPALGGLLMLGLVSTAEGYFRSILSACLDICPVSRKHCADKAINLGGVLWHGNAEFRRGAFEHMSFTSSKELKSASTAYIKYDLPGGQFNDLLSKYDVICNVRHGLVHNSGILPGRNAVQIDIPKYERSVRIDVDFAYLQSAGAVVDSLVWTFNRNLFKVMGNRWAGDWRHRADWNHLQEEERFQQIWNVFMCLEELNTRPDSADVTAEACMAAIKSENGL
jgi:hypothetical protein